MPALDEIREQKVFVLRNGQLNPVEITKGLTDGVQTEVVTGTLEPGMALVTDALMAK